MTYYQQREDIRSRFSSNPLASELLENIEHMFPWQYAGSFNFSKFILPHKGVLPLPATKGLMVKNAIYTYTILTENTSIY